MNLFIYGMLQIQNTRNNLNLRIVEVCKMLHLLLVAMLLAMEVKRAPMMICREMTTNVKQSQECRFRSWLVCAHY